MIERLALTAIALLVIVCVGMAIRRWSQLRCARLAAILTAGRSDEGLPQILSFYGSSCHACEQQKRIITELRDARAGSVSVRFIDAAAESGLALSYGVMVVPTTVVATAAGSIVAITCGLLPRERLAEQLAAAASQVGLAAAD